MNTPDNVIKYSVLKSFSYLPSSFQRRSLFLFLGILLNSALDLFGIAVVLPLIAAILKDGFIQSNAILSSIYEIGGFNSEPYFILFLSGLIFGIIVFKNLFGLWIQKTQYRFAFDAYRVVSNQVFQGAYQKGFSFFKNNNSNDIMNEVSYIPQAFSNQILINLFQFFNETVIMTFVVGGLIIFDPLIISLLLLILTPLFYGFYRLSKNRMAFYNERLAVLNGVISRPIFEVIFGYADTKINDVFSSFKSTYDKGVSEKSSLSVKNQVIQQIPNRLVEIVVLAAVLVMLLYGVFVLKDNEVLLAMLSVFGLAAFRAVPSFNRLMLSFVNVRGQQYVFKTLDKYLPLEKESNQCEQQIEFKRCIQIKDLNFCFSDGVALFKNYNEKINKGEVVGIVGKSGSGKTTLMNIMLGFLKPTSGGITIDEVTLDEYNISSWQKKIGYVSQEVFLVDGTVAENVAFGSLKDKIDENQVAKVLNKAQLTEVIDSLEKGIHTNIGERGTKLSGGQRQRIGIARALYHGAEVLFFDEATSALDNQTEFEITEAIQSLNTGELTMVIIAHRESTLKYCDRLIRMS